MRDGLDDFSWHEAMDRTHCISEMLDRFVYEHDVMHQHNDLRALANKAIEAVEKLYQAIGRKAPHMKAKP